MTYDPVQDGIEKSVRDVCFATGKPPDRLSSFVHCYWQISTDRPLADDFSLHAMPDACVNILFNQIDPEICGITALRTRHEVLNLGRSFHYVGVQLLPGVWRGDPQETTDQFVGTAYAGELPLVSTSRALMSCDFQSKQQVMSELMEWLVDAGLVVRNPVTTKILTQVDDIRSVADMAAAAGISARHLQRILVKTTGLSPHDLLKILRVQKSFRQHYLDLYSDQSHYIHSFRKITGYTPARYVEKFDV